MSSDSNRRDEPTSRIIKRLQDRIAGGDEHLRPELIDAFMRAAQEAASEEKFAVAIKRVDDALGVSRQIIDEVGLELKIFQGRALLFRAALTQSVSGPEAAVIALNNGIKHFVELEAVEDPMVQNELAMALLNRADILIDPLGACAAALSDQEQAVKIWQNLINQGSLEYRQPYINALLACSDSKFRNGHLESAIDDLKEAAEIAEEVVESGESAIQPLFVQTLLKLARLYDQDGNTDKAFDTIHSAIRTVQKLIAAGVKKARMMFTTLYLHLGMLYEKVHDSEAALREFDRCRDVFVELFSCSKWNEPERFVFRTGLANVLMCRGNMLADLKRFEEAEAAFEESVWQYQQAAEQQPEEKKDDTLIPYSIGVVQLNHANLLIAQDKFDEAVSLKLQAIKALRNRMEAGHDEVISNFLAANRKLISLQRYQENILQVIELTNDMINVLDQAVDDGKLEYRIDLALTYRHRGQQWNRLRVFDTALLDANLALRLFRTIADDDRDLPEVHIAKIQWSELLHEIAVIYVKTQKIDDAFEFFQKEMNDIIRFYEEGNHFVTVDLLLGFSQYYEFVEVLGNHLDELKYPKETYALRVNEVQNHCRKGIELCRAKLEKKPLDMIVRLFFMMKAAFFYKAIGNLDRLLQKYESSCALLTKSIEHWHLLLAGLDNLKAKERYDAAEKGEPVPDWDIPGGTENPYQDRFVFYINELRETMQLKAKALLGSGDIEGSKKMYVEENVLTAELANYEIENADRLLITSLSSHARALTQYYPVEKTQSLHQDALTLLLARFRDGEIVTEDFFVLGRIGKDYLFFLRENKLSHEIHQTVQKLLLVLSAIQEFPPPNIWLDVCSVLNEYISEFPSLSDRLSTFKKFRKMVKRHPESKSSKDMKQFDKVIKKQQDAIRIAITKLLIESASPQDEQAVSE